MYICSIISRNYFGVWDTQNRRAADAAWRNTIHQLNLRLFLAGWMDGWMLGWIFFFYFFLHFWYFFNGQLARRLTGPHRFFFFSPTPSFLTDSQRRTQLLSPSSTRAACVFGAKSCRANQFIIIDVSRAAKTQGTRPFLFLSFFSLSLYLFALLGLFPLNLCTKTKKSHTVLCVLLISIAGRTTSARNRDSKECRKRIWCMGGRSAFHNSRLRPFQFSRPSWNKNKK